MRKFISILLVVIFSVVITGCSGQNSAEATLDEQVICNDSETIWKAIKGKEWSDDQIIANIKFFGSRWPDISNQKLSEALKQISNYSIADNLKENYKEQNSNMLASVVALELFLKFRSVNLACSQMNNTFITPFDEEDLYNVYKNIIADRALNSFNGSSVTIIE